MVMMKIVLLQYSDCVNSGLLLFAKLLEDKNKLSSKTLFTNLWVGIDGKEIANIKG